MKLSQIKNSQRATDLLTKDVVVDFGADEDGNEQLMHLTVRVTGVSDKARARLASLQHGFAVPEVSADATDEERAEAEAAAQRIVDDIVDAAAPVLAELIVAWDGTDDDDLPLLPTEAVFRAQDPLVLFVLLAAVGEALVPDPKGNSKSSKRSSSAKRPAQRSRRR